MTRTKKSKFNFLLSDGEIGGQYWIGCNKVHRQFGIRFVSLQKAQFRLRWTYLASSQCHNSLDLLQPEKICIRGFLLLQIL